MCYSIGFSASSIVTTNFVTGMTYRYDPNGENCEINPHRPIADFELLIDAPSTYQHAFVEDKHTVFIDRSANQRELPEHCYQIRYHQLCDNQTFLAWTVQVVNTLRHALIPSFLTFDLNNLVDILQAEPSKRFSLQSITLDKINDLGSTHPALGHANSLLFVIICEPALKLDVYAEIANSVTRSIKEHSSVYFTVYEYPHMPQLNIAMLYGTPSATKPKNL